MRGKRRNHSPVFKAILALAANKEAKTPAQLSAEYDAHVNQIQAQLKQLLENISDISGSAEEKKRSGEQDIKELRAKIGQLAMTKGFAYLVAVMDWHSRKVLSWLGDGS